MNTEYGIKLWLIGTNEEYGEDDFEVEYDYLWDMIGDFPCEED